MPTRSATFTMAVDSILPQVDRLFVFFDRFAVPPAIEHPKITCLQSANHGDLRAAGKFLGLQFCREPCLYFSIDDDVAYPPDYVVRMIDFLQSRPKPSVVGVHASLLSRPMNSYARDRRVADRMAEVRRPWQVDVLGTDSALFDSATLTPDVRAWRYLNMVDLQFALDAARQGLERVIIPRPKRWLTSLAHDQPDSIFVKLQRDDSIQTQLARELLELDTGRQSEAAADFR